MITINADTKIAAILKAHPDALEAIVSISPRFTKLRNPLLRKLMASRTSISMASKVGGCSVNDFFKKLKPLGFKIDNSVGGNDVQDNVEIPEFMKQLTPENTIELDVRSVLDEGKDPLSLILKKTKEIQPLQTLKLINSFEPTPLIEMLGKRGYKTYSEIAGTELVYTYFLKPERADDSDGENVQTDGNWEEIYKRFEGKLKEIDVRHLEMPLPMLTILEEVDNLPSVMALYVHHKRIPVFLLPELKERKLDFRIKEISEGEVFLLIFKA
ncbi:MAG TPA: DUF2249 domain-containing protein [Chitinophagales bacterium]|nr:DUF2249 domain-containing protein [Chitinophagales bacterium]HRP38080.1 DUF2249 domain-containing protein [Chitinophagales bacterium]